MKKLILFGAGGAGVEALFAAQRAGGWSVLGFADDAPHLIGKSVEDMPVLGSINGVITHYQGQDIWFHCAVGKNSVRKKLAEMIEADGFRAATIVDPTAVVAPSATFGAGTYIGPLAFVGPGAQLGRHVIVNVGASSGHHCKIADFAQLCPGARVSGHAVLGAGSFIGSNGIVAPGIGIGDGATVAAGSFAVRDVPARTTAFGVPAKILAPPPSPV